MKLKLLLITAFSFFSITSFLIAQNNNSVHTNDTLIISNAIEVPVIDGFPNDECWQNVKWEPIDQVWMNYGDTLSSQDFTGTYKIVWSKETNLLYFLAKTTDDVFVDGYVYNEDPAIAKNYPDFDILEVFIDEDLSGGLHVFNGEGESGKEWGTNSSNAFSYHIVIKAPKDGETTKDVVVCDITGKDWTNYITINYANHFKSFTARKNGTETIWEFAIAVYSDKYDHQNAENSRVVLSPNKKMGISLAYCDNDGLDEKPKTRDNFFGSVYVEPAAFNDHWKNADGYRRVILEK